MTEKISRVLIETTVRKTLRDLKEAPERSTRNLIDMALNFADGRFQHQFFEAAQRMLNNEHSAYYDLIKETVANIGEEHILTFGMNAGYNSCTLGAKKIRSIEAKEHFNIPWVISLTMDGSSYYTRKNVYQDVIEQGKSLGIYTWAIFSLRNTKELLDLVKKQPDCAFVLFCKPSEINVPLLEEAAAMYNLMLSVEYSETAGTACSLLRERGCPHSIHIPYTCQEIAAILDGTLIKKAELLHPIFTFILPATIYPDTIHQKIYSVICSMRNSQSYKTVLFDAIYDNMLIDSIISDGVCEAGFDENGQLCVSQGKIFDKAYNMLETSLKDIFRKAFPKR